MEELDNTMIGRGRDAIDMIIDKDSFQENIIDGYSFDPDYGPGSVVGTAKLNGKPTTISLMTRWRLTTDFLLFSAGSLDLRKVIRWQRQFIGLWKPIRINRCLRNALSF